MLQVARAFLAAAWQYYKNCIFTAEAKRCPAEDLLQQYYTTHDRNISEDCLLFGSSLFFFWIALQHALHRGTCLHWEQNSRIAALLSKTCITKPLGSQNSVNHNKQWAVSPLSPRLNFYISAIECITRGSKGCPVAKGTSVPSTLSLHSPRMQPRAVPVREQVLVWDCCAKTHGATDNSLPMKNCLPFPSVLNLLPKTLN